MKNEKPDTFNNLIDICIAYEEDPKKSGNTVEIFKSLLREYFFRKEMAETKVVQKIIDHVKLPDSVLRASSIFEIDLDKLNEELITNTLTETLCGKIILSEDYLKYFYHNYPPHFDKIPFEEQTELVDKIKSRNLSIFQAFEKVKNDMSADKTRKVITLIALIIKNVHLRSGHPLAKSNKPANEVISSIFREVDQVYIASGRQNANLLDDSNIRELLKAFFIIYQFSNFTELGVHYKNELERYRKRALRASVK